ncbi:4-coumarate--CoA ligase family protein [Pseudonocardiaceae bacterium YIM PH 21723]|nr:4-coumarate--CoA ligase family protein [Pseudonocardiaceae bacterium YIM PH 21723]
MIFRSPFPDVTVPDVSVPEYLFGDLGDRAERPALIDGLNGFTLTYAELAGQANRLAAALAERGIGKGDVIAMLCPNTPHYAVVFHGILRAGAVATTINSLYTPEEIAFQLRDSGAKMLFTVSVLAANARQGLELAGIGADQLVVLDGVVGQTTLAELLSIAAAPPKIDFDSANDLAVLPYSSGTTGRAKGVELTHRNLVANIAQFLAVSPTGSSDRILAVLPFFHIYGMQVIMNAPLRVGGTVVTMPKFDFAHFLQVISQHRTNRVYIAPPVAVALAKHPAVEAHDLSCIDVVFSGAAPLDEELASLVSKRLNCAVRQGYGMTEMSPVSHAIPLDRDDISVGSIGLTLPNMECKIVDSETGAEVGVGERGELWCKGPNVMRGYLNNAEATANTLDADGFLHTGDVAVVDDNGVFTIVDRVKELIKYKGYQVPPAELEAILLTHPGIADAAVIGVKDAEGEEVPKAFVVRQPSAAELSEADVMTFVAEHVAPHKKVRAVEFIEVVPKSASGKILRKDLRARETQH